jgi:hypothetical protein
MARNFKLEMCDESGAGEGAAAVEMHLEGTVGGEPALVGCTVSAAGRWGACVHAFGSAPQIVRNHFSAARYGGVFAGCDGRIEDNEFLGLGESGVCVIGGSPWVHRNKVQNCGGPGFLVAGECHAVIEANEITDCLVGVRVVGKLADVEMRFSDTIQNRLVHNGISDEHQIEAPPGVIPRGSTATVRSCRPYPFLPETDDEMRKRLVQCTDYTELVVLLRAARRHKLWKEAAAAHSRLPSLWKDTDKKSKSAKQIGDATLSAPASHEVVMCWKDWNGQAAGYGDQCVTVQAGTICEVLRRDGGWLLVATSDGAQGWCSPHVLGT